MRLKVSIVALLAAVVMALVWFHLRPDGYFNGLPATRQIRWWGYIWPFPIPRKIFSECYMSRTPDGNLVNNGPCRMYQSDGTLSVEQFYVNGVLEGTERDYNAYGIPVTEIVWRHGQEISRHPCCDVH